ncbi:hypothetical protein B9G69_000035 [Bdellovibrio sp. SKB1291214]|uniref:hypothetical protein n=1 Tax=Bdellovibrio sp. SKB1291214 TaxID=1732569 RepID=UPI000B51A676|nr:hypothetical protein [Bdellovibrio sp. SKB1291214]UYL08961.1 hypothetical protein B9G69_000035 [Bdellovibrio sp. SKB1291214]
MKHITLFLTALSIFSLTSCSGGESGGTVEISVSSSLRFAIPAAGTSCYETKSALAAGTAASPDIPQAYFTIPKVTFKLNDATRDTYISAIKIYYTPPGGTQQTCALGGEQLAALKQSWWSGGKVAKIPANAAEADKVTDCAIYCGGIDVDVQNFTATGTIKVYGYTEDPNNSDDTVGFTATSFFNYGSQY